MTPLEARAKAFAFMHHGRIGQLRKYTGEPYITHPAAVVELVRGVEHTEEMLAAAWLHDTVEDTEATHEDIANEFGREVARYVWFLTDTDARYGNRKTRKKIDFYRMSAAPAAAKTIKLADLIHNTGSIMQHDPDFARVYLREKEVLLNALTDGDRGLFEIAFSQVHDGPVTLFYR